MVRSVTASEASAMSAWQWECGAEEVATSSQTGSRKRLGMRYPQGYTCPPPPVASFLQLSLPCQVPGWNGNRKEESEDLLKQT